MSVDYQCAENRELICQVNGVVVKNVEAHPAHEVASEQIEIRLKPGMNRIRLSNGNSWMPDIDVWFYKRSDGYVLDGIFILLYS